MNQGRPLRGQKMGIYAKPQITRNRKNSTTHVRDVKEQAPDSLESVICDLNAVRIFYGFLLSECTQNVSDNMKPLVSIGGLLLAFIFDNLKLMGADRTTIPSHGRHDCTTLVSTSSSSNGEHGKI